MSLSYYHYHLTTEDVLSSRVAHYWSPKDEYLCFAKFDEKDVKRQYWPMYGNLNKTYESLISVAYPKVVVNYYCIIDY